MPGNENMKVLEGAQATAVVEQPELSDVQGILEEVEREVNAGMLEVPEEIEE